jgi:hypothetical protein
MIQVEDGLVSVEYPWSVHKSTPARCENRQGSLWTPEAFDTNRLNTQNKFSQGFVKA